jgi:hypothetical protein
MSASNIDWNNVIKKEARGRGINDEDFGGVLIFYTLDFDID